MSDNSKKMWEVTLLLLSEYNGTMSKRDQQLFKLMQEHQKEQSTNLPPVWGDRAKECLAQEKDMHDVRKEGCMLALSSLNPEMLLKTALNFNPSMKLEVDDVVKVNDTEVYDQRYLLHLAAFITQDYNIDEDAFLNSKLLSIGIAALTSYDKDVWSVGILILSNFVNNFFYRESTSSYCKLLVRFIRTIGASMNHNRIKICKVASHFFIEALDVFEDTNHPFFKPFMKHFTTESIHIFDKMPMIKDLLEYPNSSDWQPLQKKLLTMLESCSQSDNFYKFLEKNNLVDKLLIITTSLHVPVENKISLMNLWYNVTEDLKVRKIMVEEKSIFIFLVRVKHATAKDDLTDEEQQFKSKYNILKERLQVDTCSFYH